MALVRLAKYECLACGYVYDPDVGDPIGGIEPGTPFEELPENWVCPECGAGKDLFERVVFQDLDASDGVAQPTSAEPAATLQKYECLACGYVYDPAQGDPDGGIAPGTSFADLPDDWACPECGAGKGMFEAIG
jgi:rubredoxin-NAD+ reductase